MTSEELLKATGNMWQVVCYKDGNCRFRLGTYYIRAKTKDGAKAAALQLSGGKHSVAWPYDPRKDLQASRYIRIVGDVAQLAQPEDKSTQTDRQLCCGRT